MTAYVIYEAIVTDSDQYEKYKEVAAPTVLAAGGRYVVRGGRVESLEGATPARVVVLEFPTFEAATAWYHSDEYASARALRADACDARVFVVDGHNPK